jgi:Bacteriocin-protection, YdeI or OmpD-Associated/Domain of unknown function (DUF1905)
VLGSGCPAILGRMRFRTVVELGGKTATGLPVPDEVVDGLGGGKKPAVVVTIGAHSYRSTVANRGGRYLLPLSAENRTAAGVAAGDEVDVRVELDTAPREVAVPEDLAAALAAADVRAAFDALNFTQRKEHARTVEEAKKPETRQRRIEKVVGSLLP